MKTGLIILIFLILFLLLLYLGDFKVDFIISKEKSDIDEPPNEHKPDLKLLTNNELKISELCAAGKSNQEIADELFLSVHTVKKHLSNIYKKLGIKSRNELREYLMAR